MKSFTTRHATTLTAHTGSMPEITLADSKEASGIWFMTDVVITGTDRKGKSKKVMGTIGNNM